MQTKMASDFYDTSGVWPRNNPADPASRFAVDRTRSQLSAPITPGLRVLDLGCNAGRFCFAMEEMGAVATGIDCSEVPLRHAAGLAREWGSRCRFVKGDYAQLPFQPGSFDLALLPNNLVECSYAEIDAMARQLREILAPGGRFCVEMHDELLKSLARGSTVGDYDPSTGRRRTLPLGPDREDIPMDCYFWTPGFVKAIIGRHLSLESEERLGENRFWLLFANGGVHLV